MNADCFEMDEWKAKQSFHGYGETYCIDCIYFIFLQIIYFDVCCFSLGRSNDPSTPPLPLDPAEWCTVFMTALVLSFVSLLQ